VFLTTWHLLFVDAAGSADNLELTVPEDVADVSVVAAVDGSV
jgi:hypothetical protein